MGGRKILAYFNGTKPDIYKLGVTGISDSWSVGLPGVCVCVCVDH